VKKPHRKSRSRRNGESRPKAHAASTAAIAATSVPITTDEPSPDLAVEPVRSWRDRLFDPVDIASIAVFRICFGLLLLYDLYTYFANGWIKTIYIDPAFHFAFFGWEFLRPLPGDGMYLLFGLLAISALLITVGLFYRVAMTVFVLGFSYVFLIDQAYYLNHFYFVALLAFLMVFIPASRGWSLDALIAGRSQDARVPAWSVWILRVQVEIMLLFAGIAKLTGDWLQGEPLGRWLANKADLPIVGPWFLNDTIVLTGAWGAALLHLIGAVMLLFKPTRIYAFAAYCVFHFLNHLIFTISIFPWITIAATLLFFDPDWPKVVWRNVVRWLPIPSTPPWMLADKPPEQSWTAPSPAMRTAIVSLLASWAVLQALLPMRHLIYPGNHLWHEQGRNFSWQMMLRQKYARAMFYVRDPETNREWLVHPGPLLLRRQYWFMVERPEMIRQFAHYLERVWATKHGTHDVEVRAITAASLNGRQSQALVDPEVDLTKIGYTLGPSDWIVALTEPMPPKGERWPGDERKTLLRNMNADPAVRRLLAIAQRNKMSSSPSEKSKKVSSDPKAKN